MNLVDGPVHLVCPSCRVEISLLGEQGLQCTECSRTWAVYQGVPHFIDRDIYWAEPGLTKEVLNDINKRIENEAWQDVLRDYPLPDVRKHYSFIANLDRAKWYALLDIGKDAVVLDLGAGMGTISQALSQQYKTVYAFEPVQERIEFMDLRFRQEGCRNIQLIRSDIDNLPFPEGSFDLVVLNGLLEWLPFSNKDRSPRAVQEYYLSVTRKLLKHNGYIYIGIENRFYYGHFTGHRDPHLPLSYVTVLPRPLAHVLCRYKIGDIYRPYLYSHRGYRQLLKDAGFQDIEIYSALPSYNNPQHLINIKSPSSAFNGLILSSKRKAARLVKKILLRTDTLKYLGYAYIIFARNGQ